MSVLDLIPGESPLDRYERLAEAFYEETGELAPGKDTGPDDYGKSYADRSLAWGEWLMKKKITPDKKETT